MSKNQNDHGVCSLCSTPVQATRLRLRCATPGCFGSQQDERGLVGDYEALTASLTASRTVAEQAVENLAEAGAALLTGFDVLRDALVAATEQIIADERDHRDAVERERDQLRAELVEEREKNARLMRRVIDAETTIRDTQPAQAVVA